MLDDFFTRALLAGIGVAAIAGPMGCFIVWRKMAYFGDTLAHAALLGVALGYLLSINLTLAVFAVSTLVALALGVLGKRTDISSDSLLGLLSHSALAIGLVTLAFLDRVSIDLESLLFGDILAVTQFDIAIIFGGGLLVLAILYWIWSDLLAVSISPELAAAEGKNPALVNFLFVILMALVIAISINIIGVLLITSLLIIPAVAARSFARSPELMAVGASLVGVLSVVLGLYSSLKLDSPSGPSIVVVAFILFLISLLPIKKFRRR